MTIPATGNVIRTESGRQIVLERTLRAPIEDVWASIVDPERMNRWIGTWSGDPGEGKRVTFIMTAEGDAPPEDVLIHRCQPPRLLDVETFQSGGSWRLQVELTEQEGTTALVFRQHIVDGDDTGSYGPGWEYYLDRLVAVHTGSPFAEWDDYYPHQKEHWEEADRRSREGAVDG